MHECLYTSQAHQQCTGIQLTVLYIKAYLLLFFVSFCTFLGHHQFLENLPGKAFETHWQFTGILIIYNGRHAKSKYLNIVTSVEIFRTRFSRPLKLIFFKFSQFSINPHIPRVYGKLPKFIII